MDAMNTLLHTLRLNTTVLSLAHLGAPWAVHSRGAKGMVLHGVVAGSCWLVRDAAPDAPVYLAAGELVLLTRGDGHRLCASLDVPAAPIGTLPGRMVGSTRVLTHGPPPLTTRLVCGLAQLNHPATTSVIGLLPPILATRSDTPARAAWTAATLALLEAEVESSGPMAASLVESLFARTLVRAAEDGATRSGLMAAIRDDNVGRALALIHSRPAEPWTVDGLAGRVGLSRTRFFERFAELVGEPPARYLARWRVHVAADLLHHPTYSTAEVAERVGYSTEDALAKVFRRHLGVSPARYRDDYARRLSETNATTAAAAS